MRRPPQGFASGKASFFLAGWLALSFALARWNALVLAAGRSSVSIAFPTGFSVGAFLFGGHQRAKAADSTGVTGR